MKQTHILLTALALMMAVSANETAASAMSADPAGQVKNVFQPTLQKMQAPATAKKPAVTTAAKKSATGNPSAATTARKPAAAGARTTNKAKAALDANYKPLAIDGHVKGMPAGAWMYLRTLTPKGLRVIDSVQTTKGGAFAFKGNSPVSPKLCFITTAGDRPAVTADFLMQPGNIKAEIEIVSKRHRITGTPLNDLYTSYKDSLNVLRGVLNGYKYSAKYETNADKKAAARRDVKMQTLKIQAYNYDFLTRNIGSDVATVILPQVYESLTPQQTDTLLNKAGGMVELPFIRKVKTDNDNRLRSVVGADYIDFTATTSVGSSFNLGKQFGKGKYVLLHFWSCVDQTSLTATAAMVRTFLETRDKTLRMVSYSVDTDSVKWASLLKDLRMMWIQVNDNKGMDSKTVHDYSVDQLPYWILFDPQGKIVARYENYEDMREGIKEYIQ